MQVKINNKKYTVPELEFKHFTKMEEQGISIATVFKKEQTFTAVMGFVCAVVDCDREEAEHLINQHVLGGGSLDEISKAFFEAVANSDFFCKVLGIKEEKPAKKAKKDEVEATEE